MRKKIADFLYSLFMREENKYRFFLFLLIAAFAVRLPTLFNDFYDVDELSAIVQTKEWLLGYIPGIEFSESKLPLYHALFKISYLISPSHGWVIVHLITIVIIFLTSLCIYSYAKRIKNHTTGAVAALLYAVLISSFNRHFMATNGEIIYNLPVTAGALFFISLIESKKPVHRVLFFLLAAASLAASLNVKFHGVILLIFIAAVIVFYYPVHMRVFRKVMTVYIILGIILLGVYVIDINFTHYFADQLSMLIKTKLFYATEARSKSPLFLAAIFSYRQLTLLLWHFIIWIPGFILLFHLLRSRFRDNNFALGTAASLFILTFLMVFGGGARVYYHYFMAAYPSLCILAAVALTGSYGTFVPKIARKGILITLIPVTFFFTWNVKDIIIKHFAPSAFYNEGSMLFWFRAVVVSSVNDYLLPNESYINTVDYIRKTTSPDDTIFVWGDGPQLYYFSDRRIAVKHVWPKNAAIRIQSAYKSKTDTSLAKARSIENEFVRIMEKKKPALVIDTSPKGLFFGVTKFGEFAKYPYPFPPLIKAYISDNYVNETKIDGFTIYRRRQIK